MFFRSGDPEQDYLEHDRYVETELSYRPLCAVCGERIQDSDALLLWDEWVCNKCVSANMADVDDYVNNLKYL